jgi:aminoglycoside phosphotransferase (APT) family kinase protein
MPDNFEQQLETILRREIQGCTALLDAEQLSAGASQETWRIRYRRGKDEAQVALRRAQPTAVSGSSVGGIALHTEAQLFRLAQKGGVPGPDVLYVLQAEDQLGEGFIMQWLEGETLGQRIVHAPELADIRPQLARRCGEILAQIHALDVSQHPVGEQLPEITPAELVDETWRHYCALDIPVPMIDYTWRWLRDHLPRQHRTTLVHGDFRNGNLMINASGINAVLDWELAHRGDPVRDLGWLCVNSWRFGNSALTVGGFGEIDDLLAGYREAGGMQVTRDELKFWQVFGSFWWAMATLQMANAWRTGETPSLERPVIGRRSSEAQMDCVNLLIPGSLQLPPVQKDLTQGTQLPMAVELLDSVRGFLRQDVADKLDPHNHFLARVAANSLGIAQREILYGEQLRAAERERLQQLLHTSETAIDPLRSALVDALRKDLPLDTPGLAPHLRQCVAGQLFIDQPHYSALHTDAP